MSQSYVIEIWEPGQERVILGPYRSLEKAESQRDYIEARANVAGIDIETAVVELNNSHTAVSEVFELVRQATGTAA